MNDPSSATAISPLRQRLIDDMNVRRFSRERSATTFATSNASRRFWGAHPIPPRRMTCATVLHGPSPRLAG